MFLPWLCAAALAAEERREPDEMIEIIGSATIPGLEQPLDRLPQNVQPLDERDLDRAGGVGLGESFARAAVGVHAGGTRSNPFQPDLLFRGFESSEANGDHTFERIDPAVGVTLRASPRLGFFASYAQSFRAPTAIDLTCASPTDPCPLPVAFANDPPLRKVRARTYEVGVRAEPIDDLEARIAGFRTDLDDDILFVSASRALGFFQNVEKTRPVGVEALLRGRLGDAAWFVNYGYTRPTFETAETLFSAVGESRVRPGDVIPGIPDHLLRAGVEAPLPASFRIGFDLAYTGRQFLRSDEANELPPLSSYVTVNGRLEWRRGPLTVFARAENLLDAEYETAGSQAENPFAGYRVERFLSPGAPLGRWLGVRLAI